MKKVILVLLALGMIFTFAGCKGSEEELKETASPEPGPTEEAIEEPTKEPETESTPKPTEEPVDLTGLVNVALGKPVDEFGFAYRSGFWNKDFLVDGFKMEDDVKGQTTGWMSDASDYIDDETWVYIDLEEVYQVSAVALYPRESETFFPVAYDIQISLDATSWTTVKSIEDDWGYLDTNRMFGIGPVEAQYVRILVKERYDVLPGLSNDGYIVEISEIEVYALAKE